eukprot:SAG25_NODE_9282_length_379_cov_1.571429_2_plen_31_part_01
MRVVSWHAVRSASSQVQPGHHAHQRPDDGVC